MLALPPMLILDEAPSSIDTRMELKIQNAFAEMMKGRTSFIVAHRLSTIESADVILVMKDGKIMETGNHAELLAKKGFYHHLYNSQFSGVAVENDWKNWLFNFLTFSKKNALNSHWIQKKVIQ